MKNTMKAFLTNTLKTLKTIFNTAIIFYTAYDKHNIHF